MFIKLKTSNFAALFFTVFLLLVILVSVCIVEFHERSAYKIAIITLPEKNSGRDNGWDVVPPIIEKYGEEKVLHITWPDRFMEEQQQKKMVEIVEDLGKDPKIKAIIVGSPVIGINAAFERLREIRKDVFVVYCSPLEEPVYTAGIADLILETDTLGMGPAMVEQSYKFGAKIFVYYSFPWHMEQKLFFERHELIKQKCDELDIEFVDATTTSPFADHDGPSESEQLLADIPKMVEKYGKNTAFFGANGLPQHAIIKAVVETGAIFPQSCHPSPFEGFPLALFDTYIFDDGLEINPSTYEEAYTMMTAKDVNDRIRETLAEENMLGRLSTWPVKDYFMYASTCADYAFMRIDGKVPQKGIDIDVLEQIMADYAGVDVFLTPYGSYDNYLLMRMDYITY